MNSFGCRLGPGIKTWVIWGMWGGELQIANVIDGNRADGPFKVLAKQEATLIILRCTGTGNPPRELGILPAAPSQQS